MAAGKPGEVFVPSCFAHATRTLSIAPQAIAAALADRYRFDTGTDGGPAVLGHGGMATVYRAHDLRHDRPVAIKVFRPEVASILGADRFLQEIRITAGFNHPHILPLYDSGSVPLPGAPVLYYVMPLVEGESLRSRLDREGRLPVEEAARLAAEVADALSYAHRSGVVHRDIKPENILLSSGHAVVADFGIARAVSAAGSDRLTQPGLTVGTPSYMSPEQAAGETNIDGRSDLYSLGTILFEMLAGRPPFTGSSPAGVLGRVVTEPPPLVQSIRSDVPDALASTVARALAKDPADRFRDAEEMTATLRGKLVAPVALGRSLVVLPFVNLNPDPESEFFSDGVTEELINALARVEGLRVVSRTSAFAFKGRQEDIRRIGERLSVETVLEGSVRQAGRRLRVTAQLVNVANGFSLWSETFDRELEDVFAIQDEIAGAITAALEVRLLGRAHAPRKPPTADLGAYSLYLKGRHFWNRRTDEALRTGLGYFEQALARDPDYALAHAGVADSHIILAFYCASDPMEAFPRARAAAQRALELDPDQAEAVSALAYVAMYHDWDWAEAERLFRRGISLNAGYATIHQWYGNFLATQGRFDESIAAFDQAIVLDPISPLKTGARGWGCYFARRYEEAADYHRQALVLDPAYLVAHLWLGLALEEMGQVGEAVHTLETAVELSGSNPVALALLGHAHAVAGQGAEARRLAAELTGLKASQYVSAYDIATIHVGLEEPEPALDWLERGYQERTHWMALLKVDPRLDPLRDLPRFKALLQRMRLG